MPCFCSANFHLILHITVVVTGNVTSDVLLALPQAGSERLACDSHGSMSPPQKMMIWAWECLARNSHEFMPPPQKRSAVTQLSHSWSVSPPYCQKCSTLLPSKCCLFHISQMVDQHVAACVNVGCAILKQSVKKCSGYNCSISIPDRGNVIVLGL